MLGPVAESWLKSRFGLAASSHRRRRTQEAARRRREFALQNWAQEARLEERMLMSADTQAPVPVPNNPTVPKVTDIFWNGGIAKDTESGVKNNDKSLKDLKSPEAAGAMKTITITNYSTSTIFPFLRSANGGQDPKSTNYNKDTKKGGYYDPQDFHGHEFRQYLGYSKGGKDYLGLPPGATVKFQVPLVLWDGDNLSLVTDGKYLTKSGTELGATVFNYNVQAQINIQRSAKPGDNPWVRDYAHYPTDEKPLVMFYFANTAPKTVPNDAPAQLAELTFRDPYLKQFIDDPSQTFPEINYDTSYVNTLEAPVAIEAGNAPVYSGKKTTTSDTVRYYGDPQAFGWNGATSGTQEFNDLAKQFVNNTGRASIGQYFGGKGWPQYYNPDPGIYIIPSGANIFDNSPLDVRPNQDSPVLTSNYDPNRWQLSSNGNGAIRASQTGKPETSSGLTRKIDLFAFGTPALRANFVADINSMLKTKPDANVTVGGKVVGTLTGFDDGGSVQSYQFVSGGSGYSSNTTVTVVSRNGKGSGATGDVHVVNGVITSIGITPEKGGSGYTEAPDLSFNDPGGKGKGAKFTAVITGGTATVKLNDANVTLPSGPEYIFSRPADDYAAKAITNLWYGWANYYADHFRNAPVVSPVTGSYVFKSVDGSGPAILTNEIKLSTAPDAPLAVGMTVSAPNLPANTTILKVVGTTIYLSQLPLPSTTEKTPSQKFTFGNPAALSIDDSKNFTTPLSLSFSADETPKAMLFAGSVYEAMAIESHADKSTNSPYLPTTMNVVDNVIKFNALIATQAQNAWGKTMVGEVRDDVKSILRGVYDFTQVPDQSLWYPAPATKVPGTMIGGAPAQFNVYNLDPYVWFVHTIEGLSGYGFSVDDDVANPSATGPDGVDTAHLPNDLVFGFAGINGGNTQKNATPLPNQEQWFPTTRWGRIETTATIGTETTPGQYFGKPIITLTGPDAQRLMNQIFLPGDGQIGAYVTAPGYIVPGTTLIFFPDGTDQAGKTNIMLSQSALPTKSGPIKLKIFATPMTIPTVPVTNANFAVPAQKAPDYFTKAPTDQGVGWTFTGMAGIAGPLSTYMKNNPAPGGAQVGFIQNGGSISQTVTLQDKSLYAVSFLVAERQVDNRKPDAQTLQVKLGDKVVGNFKPTPTDLGNYVLFTSDPIPIDKGGKFNLVITGTNVSGDNMALIDNVAVTGGPTGLAHSPAPGPVVKLGNAVIQGARFQETGSISGASSGAITATVDYGDGTGVQKLVLSPSGTFTLNHTYSMPGTFKITLNAKGSSGKLATATVSLTATAGQPLVSGFGTARDAFIATLYRENLGALPDPSTLKSLSGRLAAGADPKNVAMSIWGSSQHLTLVKQGLIPPLPFQQAYRDAVHAARQAARTHQPPAGPPILRVNP